jgi:hypothetical protein
MSEPDEHVYFDPSNYSIENAVLDPVGVGLLLLSEAHPGLLAAMEGVNFVTFKLQANGQKLTDVVTEIVHLPGDNETPISVPYSDSVQLVVPSFWKEMQGHQLEELRIKAAFPTLRAHRDRLVDHVIDRIWRSHPGVIPLSTIELFGRLLA